MRESRRLRGILGRSAAVSALLLGTIGVAMAPPAAAETLTGPSTALIWQDVTYTVGSVTSGTYTLVNGLTGQQLAVAAVGLGATSVPLTFTTPAAPTNMSIYAAVDGSPITSSINLNVTGVTTTTTSASPNTAQVNVGNNLVFNVQSQSPSTYLPTGTVTIRDANNNVMTTLNLGRGATTSQASAIWVWTPTVLGNYIFTATFNPAGGTFASASSSPATIVTVTPSGSNIALTVSSQVNVNSPTMLTATVFPPSTQGSAGFTINGQAVSPSVPLVNGVASFLWTPAIQGQTIVGANFTSNGGATGSTSAVVTVGATATPDVITVIEQGGRVLPASGVGTLGNGARVSFTSSTASGAAITFSETGPCQFNGNTFVVDQGSGQCRVTASSPGGNGYAAVSVVYTVNLVPGQQVATLAAPQSGRVNAGRTLRLESAAQGDTNAGQNINWRITQGRNTVCALRFPSSGAVTLRILKRGKCTVNGRAAAVAGQWNAFSTWRTYRGV